MRMLFPLATDVSCSAVGVSALVALVPILGCGRAVVVLPIDGLYVEVVGKFANLRLLLGLFM